MDFDSSNKFVASLAKFLQSLCNGYVDFDKGVEVIGHIHINVDSDLGKKVDYVLNERVCKNDNSITFISNSFPAQPAEKPAPPPKKPPESDKNDSEQSVVMDDSGQMVPNSTNVGTLGSYRSAASRANSNDGVYSPGSKRPRSPQQRRGMGLGGSPLVSKHGMPQSPRYQDSGGPHAKMGRTDIPPGSDSDGGVFQSGADEDDYSSNYGDQNPSEVDQKPVIDPDISIVKEEHLASQQQSSCAYAGGNQYSGPGRGRPQPAPHYPGPSMMNQNPSNYPGANQLSQSDMYSGSSLEGGADPSTLTRAQQEELEMYYRKGTDQHLTFLRNMREAHAMYPFTGKRDKELFEKALAELFRRMPVLRERYASVVENFYINSMRRLYRERDRAMPSQFKSPGQGGRGGGQQFGRQQQYYGQMPQYPYGGSYPGTPVHPGQHMGMERRMSSAGSEGGDSFLQAPGDESYDYQQEDSRDTQHSLGGGGGGDQGQSAGFHGAFADNNGGGGQGQSSGQARDTSGDGAAGEASGQHLSDPPDIKQEMPSIPFMSGSEFELIEIDPDEEDEI